MYVGKEVCEITKMFCSKTNYRKKSIYLKRLLT